MNCDEAQALIKENLFPCDSEGRPNAGKVRDLRQHLSTCRYGNCRQMAEPPFLFTLDGFIQLLSQIERALRVGELLEEMLAILEEEVVDPSGLAGTGHQSV